MVDWADALLYRLTHSGWFDAKLALPVYQAVLNDSEEARVSVCSADTNYGGAQVHVLKHRLLQTDKDSFQLRDTAMIELLYVLIE